MLALKLKKTHYSPKEVGLLVGVSRQTVVSWIASGRLASAVTEGGHHRIPSSAFTSDVAEYELVPVKGDPRGD